MFSRKEAPFKVLVKNFTFLEMGTERPTAVVQSSEGGKDMSEAGAGLSPDLLLSQIPPLNSGTDLIISLNVPTNVI